MIIYRCSTSELSRDPGREDSLSPLLEADPMTPRPLFSVTADSADSGRRPKGGSFYSPGTANSFAVVLFIAGSPVSGLNPKSYGPPNFKLF